MAFRWLVLVLVVAVVAGCSGRNPARVELCLAALAGLEPGEGALEVAAVGGEAQMVSLRYSRGGLPGFHRLQCRFAGDATALGQLDLEAAVLDGVELGPGQLSYLKSHWLATDGPFLAKARLVLPPAGYFSIPAAAGPYLQSALSALPIAAVYVLLALGFALIHGLTGRMNIAHGEFATIGAYAGYAGFMALGSLATGAGIAGAVAVAAVASASAGYLAITAVFAPLARRDGQMLLVASAGLILVFEESVRLSHDSRELWLPPILSDPLALTPPPYVVTVTGMQAAVAAAAALVVLAVLALLRRSRFGRAWRAVADDPLAARFMGIDPARILALSALLSAGLAGLGGLIVLLGYGNATHSMGLMLSIKAMVAALIGGMGSPGGAVLGAVVLAAIETLWAVAFGNAYRDAAVFAILVGLLTLAPDGLFGLARR